MTGPVALITGASSGIGLACARRIAADGMRLVVGGRRADRLAALAQEFPALVYRAADLSAAGEVDALFELALTEFGRLDIVVNNAGAMVYGPIETIDLDAVGAMIRLNVEAAARVMYRAVAAFRAQDSGHLFNITSTTILRAAATGGAYAATKHAIAALSQALRLELARTGVRITDIAPGLIETELHRELPRRMSDILGYEAPLTADDVVDTLIFALRRPHHVRIPLLVVTPGESGQ